MVIVMFLFDFESLGPFYYHEYSVPVPRRDLRVVASLGLLYPYTKVKIIKMGTEGRSLSFVAIVRMLQYCLYWLLFMQLLLIVRFASEFSFRMPHLLLMSYDPVLTKYPFSSYSHPMQAPSQPRSLAPSCDPLGRTPPRLNLWI
jgi:hypothetical protein